jgi:hypothetical protein
MGLPLNSLLDESLIPTIPTPLAANRPCRRRRTENRSVWIMTKANYHNLPPVVEPLDGLNRATPLTKTAGNPAAMLKLPADKSRQLAPEESPLRESSLHRLGTQIPKAAAILGSLLVRLLGVAFYLEIRLFKSLKRPQSDPHRRRNEIDSSSKDPVCNVPLFSE